MLQSSNIWEQQGQTKISFTKKFKRRIGVSSPGMDWEFSLHRPVQTGSEAHPASYPMGTRGSFPGNKAAGAWSWSLTSI